MTTSSFQKWNQYMKLVFIGMMAISLLGVSIIITNWTANLIGSAFGAYELYQIARVYSNITHFLISQVWLFCLVWLFLTWLIVDEADKQSLLLYIIGAAVYATIQFIECFTSDGGYQLVFFIASIKVSCFVLMILGAIKMAKSKTLPNNSGMIMIIISSALFILGELFNLPTHRMSYHIAYSTYHFIASLHYLAAYVFLFIGWKKQAQPKQFYIE